MTDFFNPMAPSGLYRRDEITGRMVAVADASGVVPDGHVSHVPMAFADAAGPSSQQLAQQAAQQAAQAHIRMYGGMNARSLINPAVAQSSVADAAHAQMTQQMRDSWRTDGSSGAPVPGDAKALRDASYELSLAEMRDAWRL